MDLKTLKEQYQMDKELKKREDENSENPESEIREQRLDMGKYEEKEKFYKLMEQQYGQVL